MERLYTILFYAILLIVCILSILIIFSWRRKNNHQRQSAKFIKGVISAIDGVVALLDKNGVFLGILNNTSWNSVIDRSKRYELDYFVKDSNERSKCLEIIKTVLETGEVQRTEVGVHIRGKQYFFKIAAVKYSEDKVLVSMIDDTIAAETRAQEAEHRFIIDTVLNEMPVSITAKTLSGKYLIWNEKASEMWHFKGDDIIDKTIIEYPNPQIRDAILAIETKAIETGLPVSEVVNCTLDNEEHYIYVNKLVLNFSNEENWILSTAVEVTNLVKNEQLIYKLNQEMRMVYRSLKLASFTIDVEKSIIECDVSLFFDNPSIKSFSMTLDEYLYYISENYKSDAKQSLKQLIAGDVEILCDEFKVKSFMGGNEEIWLESYAIATKRDAKGYALQIVGGAVNITKRKNLEIILEREKIAAQQSNKQKSAYLANMSHDIRTPLNAIIGFSEILVDLEDKEERSSISSIIKNNSDVLLRLIDDILDISKIEAGTLQFSYEDIDINNLFDEMAPVFQMKMKNGVQLIIDKTLDNCVMSTDRARLTQVLTNFVTNAVKFTDKGSITLGYKLKDSENIMFYVKDTGCGISEDNLKIVFNRFVRLNPTAAGTGLGLSISSLIVESMGGNISAESKLGEGSTFWCSLPYKRGAVSLKESTSLPNYDLLELKNITILVAEDNESNYLLLSSILKDFKLIHAWNGEEAVKLYQEHKPDIILMDIMMPIMDGFQANAAIRAISTDVPIIAVTAYASSEDKIKIKNANFSGLVTKPVNMNTLMETIFVALNLNTR